MKINITKSKNHFSTSHFLEGLPEGDNEKNLKMVSSSFIKEFFKTKKLFSEKTAKSDSIKRKPIWIGFAISSEKNRAKKAVELLFSSFTFESQIIQNPKHISLLISSNTIKINIDEIGIINDYIQEKLEYTATIVMSVNENENLGKAIAITLILHEK